MDFFTFTFDFDLHKFTLRNNLPLLIENEGLVMSNSKIQKFDFRAWWKYYFENIFCRIDYCVVLSP